MNSQKQEEEQISRWPPMPPKHTGPLYVGRNTVHLYDHTRRDRMLAQKRTYVIQAQKRQVTRHSFS